MVIVDMSTTPMKKDAIVPPAIKSANVPEEQEFSLNTISV